MDGYVTDVCATNKYITVTENDDTETLRQALEHNLWLKGQGCK